MKLLIGIYQYYITVSMILFSNISEKNAKHITQQIVLSVTALNILLLNWNNYIAN